MFGCGCNIVPNQIFQQEVFDMPTFGIQYTIEGSYNDAVYELETVEEALAEWALMYPDEELGGGGDDTIIIDEVHVDDSYTTLIHEGE